VVWMSRTPNKEQALAINHTGGVLLRAGAGSGKTFVLVEHLIHLTEKWMAEFRPSGGNFEDLIRSKFSQVVMMTFTKKAAGEMSIRLTDRFMEKAQEPGEHQALWQTASDALPLLNVTTIDGFCKKLISQGYFPHLSTEAEVIFEPQRIDQVRGLLESWLKEKEGVFDPSILDIVIREKRALLSSFARVFNDPGLRLSWKKFQLDSIRPEAVGPLLKESFLLNDLSSALSSIHQLDLPVESERSSFERLVAQFQSTGLPVVEKVEDFDLYRNLFASIKVLRGESGKKKTPDTENALEGMRLLRDWVKSWSDVITDYLEHYEEKILPWSKLCQELFLHIEGRIDPNQGMTFGDIEYLVLQGLENAADRERIQKTFSYLIVDEFQDTSSVQFKIIQGLIGSDYSKLFCVGDAKQAIYGFRGGELSVFQSCSELMPKVLSLANNYRSLPEVIGFNNSLFRTILPLGQNFEGHDSFTVPPEDQSVPPETKTGGEIRTLSASIERDLEVEEKLKNEDINRIEAYLIARAIKKERETSENVCTILYSKLKPSGDLIRELMEQKIGFTAQFKIDLLDDPVLGIFLCLLKRRFDSDKKTKDGYPLFLITSYLNILGISLDLEESDLQNFDQNVFYWGLVPAFRKFLHGLGVTNENADINLKTVETLSELYLEDPESIMTQLTSGDNDRLSLEFRFGERSHLVQIMSAHASKGLEFDSVYLAGIYTNGREMSDGSMFGDLPGSFTWYKDIATREKQKSPWYVYESELDRYKNFSEAKRLFYVACTRAKKNLTWVDLEISEKAFSIPKNSWILGLRSWRERNVSSILKNSDLEIDLPKIIETGRGSDLPLFFYDPMGIVSKEGKSELLISGELSVTRLNALVDCPRKFYYSNVLKFTVDEKVTYVPADDEEELATHVRSSSERGTLVHARIAEGIERNFIVPRAIFGTELEAPVKWALGLLAKERNEFEFIPEKQLKFKLFNFMISGIPDLVLLPKSDKRAQVWDFKTGKITQENLLHYWLQLKVYAYSLYTLGKVGKSAEVELVLCFVDQEKTLKETVTFEKCEQDLYPVWRSQNEPWRTNLDHCAQCSYGSICPR
jgi:ATP-dependent helicase/nuclease subunit A